MTDDLIAQGTAAVAVLAGAAAIGAGIGGPETAVAVAGLFSLLQARELVHRVRAARQARTDAEYLMARSEALQRRLADDAARCERRRSEEPGDTK